MRLKYIMVFCLVLFSSVFSQTKIWVYVKGGDTRFYNPQTMNWEPLIEKQQVPIKTYILTTGVQQFRAYNGSEAIEGPGTGYYFLDDIFPKTKVKIVENLTLIEAQQLRSASKGDSLHRKNVYGLTYGLPVPNKNFDPVKTIPHFKEWESAFNWFYNQRRYDASLLTLKRMVTQYPGLYLDMKYTDILLKLYEKLELYGFLYSETGWLMQVVKDGDNGSSIKRWNDLAKQKLTNR